MSRKFTKLSIIQIYQLLMPIFSARVYDEREYNLTGLNRNTPVLFLNDFVLTEIHVKNLSGTQTFNIEADAVFQGEELR